MKNRTVLEAYISPKMEVIDLSGENVILTSGQNENIWPWCDGSCYHYALLTPEI